MFYPAACHDNRRNVGIERSVRLWRIWMPLCTFFSQCTWIRQCWSTSSCRVLSRHRWRRNGRRHQLECHPAPAGRYQRRQWQQLGTRCCCFLTILNQYLYIQYWTMVRSHLYCERNVNKRCEFQTEEKKLLNVCTARCMHFSAKRGIATVMHVFLRFKRFFWKSNFCGNFQWNFHFHELPPSSADCSAVVLSARGPGWLISVTIGSVMSSSNDASPTLSAASWTSSTVIDRPISSADCRVLSKRGRGSLMSVVVSPTANSSAVESSVATCACSTSSMRGWRPRPRPRPRPPPADDGPGFSLSSENAVAVLRRHWLHGQHPGTPAACWFTRNRYMASEMSEHSRCTWSKRMTDILSIVINTNLPPILHRFRDIALDTSKIAIFGYPYIISS